MSRRGFTLMEILVALGIFAIIGVIASQLLRQTIEVQDVLSNRGDRLVELQRALNVVSRDLEQVTNRSVRDEFGDPIESLLIDTHGSFQFSRLGWSNLLNKPRSNLQRVEYLFVDDVFIRRYWPVLDRSDTTEPIDQELLTDINELEFVLIDSNGLEHVAWPPLSESLDGTPQEAVAFQLKINVDPFGEISRMWLMPRNPTIIETHEMGPGGTGPGRGFEGPPFRVLESFDRSVNSL